MAKVTMPQLGESVAEGTIGKWLKKPGDHVAKYEPLLEVITDKVNAEVPSPVEGILTAILVEEGATVPNNAEIARSRRPTKPAPARHGSVGRRCRPRQPSARPPRPQLRQSRPARRPVRPLRRGSGERSDRPAPMSGPGQARRAALRRTSRRSRTATLPGDRRRPDDARPSAASSASTA